MMKKIFIFLMMITSFLLINNNVVVFGAFNEDVDDGFWTYNDYTFYTYSQTYQQEGLGIGFDLGGASSTYYDNGVVDWRTFFEDFDKITLADYTSTGNLPSSYYFEYIFQFDFNYITRLLTIEFYGKNDDFNSGYSYLLDTISVTLDYEDVPLFYLGIDASASSSFSSDADKSMSLRIGKVPVTLNIPISQYRFIYADNIWDNSTSYNLGFKIQKDNFRGIYDPSDIITDMDVYISNLIAIDTDFIGLIEYYAYQDGYNQAVLDGQQVSLLDLFNTVVGWLVTFVLFFFNLSIFGLSLLDILSIGVLIVGLTWLLKLIRG